METLKVIKLKEDAQATTISINYANVCSHVCT